MTCLLLETKTDKQKEKNSTKQKHYTLPGLCFVYAISFVSMWLFLTRYSSVNIHSRQF